MRDYKDELDKNVTISLLEEGKKVDTKNLIKVLENSPKKGQNMITIGKENLNDEILKWVLENNKSISIDKLNPQRAKA
ncbi:hypothetical protein [Campylobacter sp. CCS1377]|uniref:Uncharacterized protein n=1 Tax=Campylobacter sp. CCS1377 TaxID=3158229 RepID=A0AAU7E8C8_9BACT|nr:hypothetical protein [Campylobacter jejuni]